MAYILQGTGYQAFVCSSTTLLFNTKSENVSFIEYPDVPVPEPTSKKTSKKLNTNGEHVETDQPEIKQDTKPAKNSILCACMSDCGKYLAINDDVKRLLIWKYDSSWELQSNQLVVRKCIKIKFTHSTKYLLAADKGGDVYQYLVEEPGENGKLIFGHLSMLLDMIISPDDKFIITCDRDEKIRVSNFPNSYNIHTYCLGHTQFVTTLALCGENAKYLLSGSGDSTIRVWNYLEGEQLSLINVTDLGITLPEESKTLAVKSIVSNESLAVALFDGSNICSTFLFINKVGKPTLNHLSNVNFELQPILACINDPDMFLVLTPVNNNPVTVYKKAAKDSKKVSYNFFQSISVNNSKMFAKFQFELVPTDSQLPICLFSKEINSNWDKYKVSLDITLDTQILYKQWFDNMEVYQEKKRQRLEKKSGKSKS